jgi:hypothetical protein
MPAPWRQVTLALLVAERTARAGEINYAFVDPYSLVHALVGLAMVVFGFGFLPTLALAVSWEVVEHALKNLVPAAFPHPTQDTLANSVGDVLSTALGWFLTSRLVARVRRHA